MKQYVEKYLTRIPMYLLVWGSLLLLLGIAMELSFFGAFSFSGFAVLASSSVFVVTGMAASYGLGKLYGLHSHLQSALITALILACIFTPALDGATLLQYVMISIIAQASKFVITHKGRHIFNPAALGAVVGGVAQLHYASWWVGTPVMVIPVVVIAFLVLYKTRQLQLGLTFLAISLALLLLKGVSIATALGSWPLLFLAGIMLSEPATLPPRKWQKLMVAAVVAVIVSLPFQIGWLYSSPALALLIGNAVAFGLAFRQRKGLHLVFKQWRSLTPTTKELVFISPTPLVFEPGQYVELTLPHRHQDIRGIRRTFSVTSVPGEKEMRLGVKFQASSSTFKKQLSVLTSNTVVQATGVSGDFVLPKNHTQKLLFVAGGIGITPFISQIQAQGEGRNIVLLYFAREPLEAAYKDFLDSSGITVHYFAAEKAEVPFTQASRLTTEILASQVPDIRERIAYISGSPVMVDSAKSVLSGKAKGIKTDYFSGY